MLLACPAIASLAGPPGPPVVIIDDPPPPVTTTSLLADRVAVSYSPPSDFAGYHFRWASAPGQAWASCTDVDPPPVGLRASPYVLLAELPAAAVEVLVKPQDAAGQEGDPEARQLLGAAPPIGLSLAPDYAVAWALQHSDSGAGVNQHAGDAELHGGTAGDNVTDRAAALWTLVQFTPPFSFKVTYNPGTDPSPTPAGGIFFQIAFALALGADPNVARLPAGTTPRDATYGALLNGLRLSVDTNGFSGAGSNQIRLRAYNGAGVTGDLAVAGGQKTVVFPRDQDAVIEGTAPGDDTLSCKVTFADGTSVVQDFQDAAIRTWLGTRTVNVGLLAWSGRSAKLSAASERAVVVRPPPGGNEGLAPPFSAPAASTNIIQATAANFTAKYGTAGGGDTVLVAPGFVYSGNLNLGRSGSRGGGTNHRPDGPIVVRVGTLAADGKTIVDPASFPAATVTGDINYTGNYNWVRGFAAGSVQVAAGSVGSRFNRGTTKSHSQNDGTYSSFDWFEMAGFAGEFLTHSPKAGCRFPFVYRGYLHHDVGTVAPHRVFMNIGFDNDTTATPARAYVRDCLFADNQGGVQQAVEIKSSDNTVERCAAVSAGASDHLRFNVRHGQRNRLLALWGDLGQIEVRGPDHLLADCTLSGSDYVGPASGNCTYAQWLVFVSNGQQAGKYPSADGVRVVRCDSVGVGDSTSGVGSAGFPTYPAGTQLWNVGGTVTYHFGSGAGAWTVPTVPASDTHAGNPSDVPPRTDGGAKRWAVSDVGPGAAWDPADNDTSWYMAWRALADA